MSEIQVASRYAKSLIDLATEQNILEPIRSDIELFIRVVKENPELRAVLKNPIIDQFKKMAILDQIFDKQVNPMLLSFFKITIRKSRAEILYATAKEFITEYNIRKNIIKAVVTSAVPLSEENKKQIVQLVKDAVEGEVTLVTKIDPALIGGFVLTVGDKQFDASILNNLNKLRKEFNQKLY